MSPLGVRSALDDRPALRAIRAQVAEVRRLLPGEPQGRLRLLGRGHDLTWAGVFVEGKHEPRGRGEMSEQGGLRGMTLDSCGAPIARIPRLPTPPYASLRLATILPLPHPTSLRQAIGRGVAQGLHVTRQPQHSHEAVTPLPCSHPRPGNASVRGAAVPRWSPRPNANARTHRQSLVREE